MKLKVCVDHLFRNLVLCGEVEFDLAALWDRASAGPSSLQEPIYKRGEQTGQLHVSIALQGGAPEAPGKAGHAEQPMLQMPEAAPRQSGRTPGDGRGSYRGPSRAACAEPGAGQAPERMGHAAAPPVGDLPQTVEAQAAQKAQQMHGMQYAQLPPQVQPPPPYAAAYVPQQPFAHPPQQALQAHQAQYPHQGLRVQAAGAPAMGAADNLPQRRADVYAQDRGMRGAPQGPPCPAPGVSPHAAQAAAQSGPCATQGAAHAMPNPVPGASHMAPRPAPSRGQQAPMHGPQVQLQSQPVPQEHALPRPSPGGAGAETSTQWWNSFIDRG